MHCTRVGRSSATPPRRARAARPPSPASGRAGRGGVRAPTSPDSHPRPTGAFGGEAKLPPRSLCLATKPIRETHGTIDAMARTQLDLRPVARDVRAQAEASARRAAERAGIAVRTLET